MCFHCLSIISITKTKFWFCQQKRCKVQKKIVLKLNTEGFTKPKNWGPEKKTFKKGDESAKRLTLTLCRSIGFMMVPWKNSTVVKCLLKRPSSSRSGGFLHIATVYHKNNNRIRTLKLNLETTEYHRMESQLAVSSLIKN